MSQQLHHIPEYLLNGIEKTLRKVTFEEFSAALFAVLKIRNVIVTVKDFNQDLLIVPGHRFTITKLWTSPIITESLASYLSDIRDRANKLLKDALSDIQKVDDQIEFLRNQLYNYKKQTSYYNTAEFEYTLTGFRYWIETTSACITCSGLQLNSLEQYYSHINYDLSARESFLASIGRDISRELEDILHKFNYQPKFQWNSETPELDISEIALAIVSSDSFAPNNVESHKLFATKLLELFGFSDKNYSRKRGQIIDREPSNSILITLFKKIEELHNNRPLPGSTHKRK